MFNDITAQQLEDIKFRLVRTERENEKLTASCDELETKLRTLLFVVVMRLQFGQTADEIINSCRAIVGEDYFNAMFGKKIITIEQ